MRTGLKLVLVTLPIVAAGAGFLAYTVQTKAPPAQVAITERARAVRVVQARSGTVAPRLTGYGLVAPATSFEAIAQVGGSVAWVNPDLVRGAVLPTGAPLLRIADEDYALAVAQAEANIRAAEAKLTELEVSDENQRAALAIEREALKLKADDLARAETLQAGGTMAQSGLDAARAAHLAQRQKVQSIESTLALIPTQRRVQEESLAVARAALQTARLNLGRTALNLPFAARVASVNVEAGRYLRVGEVAATLDGIAAAEVEAQVPVAELRRLLRLSAPDAAAYAADPTAMTDVLRGLDLTAEVRLDLADEVLTWPATVDRVSNTIDARAGTLGVIVSVADAYARAEPAARPPLTKGMFVEVSISGRPVAGLVLPRGALQAGAVLVADANDRLARVEVTPALVQDDIAVIAAGLDPGARVVVSDMGLALPGLLLAPTDDPALAARLEAVQ